MTAVLESATAQRDTAKRATFDKLKSKPRSEDEFTAKINGESMSFLFRSIGARQYDKLIDECPASTEQLAAGDQFDLDKFAPELLARVCAEPELTAAQWAEIWKSPDWSRGETGQLYNRAMMLCMRGLDMGPTVAG